MQAAFERLGIWDVFLDVCCRAFSVLQRNSGRILQAAEIMLPYAGFPVNDLRDYLAGPNSLNIRSSESLSIRNVRTQLSSSASAWKTKLKSIFHNNVDPVFYALLKNHFPPAVLAMKLVDASRDSSKAVQRSLSSDLSLYNNLSLT
jgi:hypothetical protein